MHRAAGCYQVWEFCNNFMRLSRNPWIHLSDGAGTVIQGMSCAKNTPCRVKVKYFYPMESGVFKPSITVSRSDNSVWIAESRRIVSTTSLQSRGNAKRKLVDLKYPSGRYLASKKLMESTFQVLRDLRNENFGMGVFRLGRSAASENNRLSLYASEDSGGTKFKWSPALWKAKVSNVEGDEVLSKGSPVHGEIRPTDKPLDTASRNDNGSRVSNARLSSSGDPSLSNALEAAYIHGTAEIPVVNMQLSDLSLHDSHEITPQKQKIQEEAVEESRNISDHHCEGNASNDIMDTKHTIEQDGLFFSSEPSEDGGLAHLKKTTKESTGESELQEEMERLKKLRDAVAHHAYLYNTLDNPIISDSAYDALVKEMKQVEALTVGVHDSPALIVGAPPSSVLLKVQHNVPMLSLSSVQREEELVLWHQRLQQRLGAEEKSVQWVVEPKVDGLALSLRYENGKLVCAATRGNGLEGEDVTHNAQNVRNIPSLIPQQLPDSSSLISSLEVRGEIYMPLKDFGELNYVKLQSGEKPFANPRNAAAGSMRLLSSQELNYRPLSFVAYSIASIMLTEPVWGGSERSPPTPSKQWEGLQLMKSLGFFVNEDNQIFDSFESAVVYAKSWMNKRQCLSYEADGVVFKINDEETKVLLGSVGGDPRWAVAWKFAATEVVTVLEAIELTVGRTGVIVPNARLKPVELGGVSIRRASLHNFRHVKTLGLCEGDHVIVQRAGDVIPQVVQPLEELRLNGAHPWVPPTQCPSCGSELTEEPSKAMVFCRNSDCSSRRSRQVEHFTKSLISGLGPKILTQLQAEGLVVDVADLYSLNEEELSNLPRLGKKSARKLLNAVEESKGKPDWEFIAALGIPRVGVGISQRLDEHFGGLRGLLNASDDELLSVPGVGEQILNSVFKWCRCESNIGIVSELLAAGCARASSQLKSRGEKVSKSTETAVTSDSDDHSSFGRESDEQLDTSVERTAKDENSKGRRTAADTQPKLLGKVVVVTGSFGPCDRDYMHKLVRSHGGKVRTSVTPKTSFVLAGTNPGPKKVTACKQLGIDILDWERFHSLIEDP